MDLGKTMPQTVAPFQPSAAEVLASKWLTEPELGVYTEEYGRTGFQGALQAYRVYSDPDLNAELRLFSGKTIDVPSLLKILLGVQITVPSGPSRFSEALGFGRPCGVLDGRPGPISRERRG
jgi:hypothetical protein